MVSNEAALNFWTQDYLTGNWGGWRDRLQQEGITLAPVWTGEVLGNPLGGRRQGVVSDGIFYLPFDVDFDPMTGGAVKDLTFHINAYYIYGGDLSDSYVGDFSTTSNIAAYNTLRLDELWIQKGLWDSAVTIRIGNMAVEDKFFQADSADLFINGTFGELTLVANNVPDVPIYPVSSPGVRFQLLPSPACYLLAGVYGLDAGSNPAVNNQNGTRFSLNGHSGLLVMTEAGYLANHGPKDEGLQPGFPI